MKQTKVLLKPVSREAFSTQFGGAIDDAGALLPKVYFEPVLEAFSRYAVGPYFWFIADTFNGTVPDAGGSIETLCNFSRDEFAGRTPEVLFRNTHPEDLPAIFAFTNYWVSYVAGRPPAERSNLRPSIYIRLLNAAAEYYWAMVQYSETIVDKQGIILFGLAFVTDISHIKQDGEEASMSILNTHEQTCHQFFCSSNHEVIEGLGKVPKISGREIEVLRLLAVGHSSKQIAVDLALAVKTIDNHRQNLLRKMGARSTGELVTIGIKSGFI